MANLKSTKKKATKKTTANPVVVKAAFSELLKQDTSARGRGKQEFYLLSGNKKFKIPQEAVPRVINLLNPVKDPDLTTQEVADLLNVSRPYVVKLIRDGQLKAHGVGNRNRVAKSDAIAFRAKMRNEQNDALDEMTAIAEELGLDF